MVNNYISMVITDACPEKFFGRNRAGSRASQFRRTAERNTVYQSGTQHEDSGIGVEVQNLL